ncbi:hypothetical protein GL279_15590 [Paracoccus limosus]|jgi:hypothetical protein|uniref:Uncharacterized protein n=1 Tax=Paracoccus limosus TaxID=913252 RepID=A0A844H897_9RHOB|nr:hypothetical protein [Paracoccus limosus]MTH36024.1 hypothetical protein [Paracoccus limosus]
MRSLLPVFINAPSRYIAQLDGSNLIELTVLLTPEETYRLFDLAAQVELDGETASILDEWASGQGPRCGGEAMV